MLHSITGRAWKKIGIHPHHGINLPLSALHSAHSCGIGEFLDLLPLIDWCQRLKMDLIQLLPLNDSDMDPSPYNAISSCALNPVYLSLHALPSLEKHPELKLPQCPKGPRIAYAEVVTLKTLWLRAYFERVGDKMVKSKEVQAYIAQNPWVEHYALFKTGMHKHPLNHAEFTKLRALHHSEISFHIVVQYLCFTQLKTVKAYANQKGVFLMGDLPILVSAASADVWEHPEFFNTNLQAGAPPDQYNKEGQNWGFPLYQWDAMRKTHFSWWKQRLKYAEHFFDLFRLDHVLGFFRIWGILPGRHPKEGMYIPPDKEAWEPQGKELLTMLAHSTCMLPIAEDLGTVPDGVRSCLRELGICGTKVMRWETVWEEDNRFIPIQYYPPVSITCVSTHDLETLTLWWRDCVGEAKAFAAYKHWTYTPILSDAQRTEILWDSHHTSSLFHVNLLQEYLALFPQLCQPDPEEERINIPGKILPTNWTYRFLPSVEELTKHKELFLKMEHILSSPTPI